MIRKSGKLIRQTQATVLLEKQCCLYVHTRILTQISIPRKILYFFHWCFIYFVCLFSPSQCASHISVQACVKEIQNSDQRTQHILGKYHHLIKSISSLHLGPPKRVIVKVMAIFTYKMHLPQTLYPLTATHHLLRVSCCMISMEI